MGKHGVVTGGAGAASVGEAGGILLCWGAQVQILLQDTDGGKRDNLHSDTSSYVTKGESCVEGAERQTGDHKYSAETQSTRAGTFQRRVREYHLHHDIYLNRTKSPWKAL